MRYGIARFGVCVLSNYEEIISEKGENFLGWNFGFQGIVCVFDLMIFFLC